MKKIVGSTLDLKQFSHWTSTNWKIWVENSVFAIQQRCRNAQKHFIMKLIRNLFCKNL